MTRLGFVPLRPVDTLLLEAELRVFGTARALPAYRRLVVHHSAGNRLFNDLGVSLTVNHWRRHLLRGGADTDIPPLFPAGHALPPAIADLRRRVEPLLTDHAALTPAPESFFDDLAMLDQAWRLVTIESRLHDALAAAWSWDGSRDGAARALAGFRLATGWA